MWVCISEKVLVTSTLLVSYIILVDPVQNEKRKCQISNMTFALEIMGKWIFLFCFGLFFFAPNYCLLDEIHLKSFTAVTCLNQFYNKKSNYKWTNITTL